MSTTTETTETTGLSTADIKALRTADEVHARHSKGQSQLEAILRKREKNSVFENDGELRRVILTQTHMIHYRSALSEDHSQQPYCFAFSIGGKYDEQWKTIVSLLRAGDELELEWVSSNSNGYMKAAHGVYGESRYEFDGLLQDILRLRVYRKGTRKYLFHVHNCVCPDNSARMIRQSN